VDNERGRQPDGYGCLSVTDVKVSDRVAYALMPGAYAEYAVVQGLTCQVD
jgi:hypothetical protein